MAQFGELRRLASSRAAPPIASSAPWVTVARDPVKEQWEQLYRKRARVLRRWARMKVAAQAVEDIVQESFLALYWAMIRPDRKQIDDHWGYLKGIARHVVANHYREQAKQSPSRPLPEQLDRVIRVQDHGQDHADDIIRRLDVNRAKRELLTPRQGEVASLRYDDDLVELDIAARLGIKRGTVSRHLTQINASLKRPLRGYGPEEGRRECL